MVCRGRHKGFFDNINHHTLINILKRRINDEKFIRLIWKFLRAGYLEEWTYNNTFSGTPQGGIISPILSNIYLNELDKFMKIYKQQFDKGSTRKTNRDYGYLSEKKYRLRKKHKEQWGQMPEEEKEKLNYSGTNYTKNSSLSIQKNLWTKTTKELYIPGTQMIS